MAGATAAVDVDRAMTSRKYNLNGFNCWLSDSLLLVLPFCDLISDGAGYNEAVIVAVGN